jgi:hypothetical protein
MTRSVMDAAAADMADLAKLREGLAADFGDVVELTAEQTAARISPPHHAALIARLDGVAAGFLSYSVFPSICRPGDWGRSPSSSYARSSADAGSGTRCSMPRWCASRRGASPK